MLNGTGRLCESIYNRATDVTKVIAARVGHCNIFSANKLYGTLRHEHLEVQFADA